MTATWKARVGGEEDLPGVAELRESTLLETEGSRRRAGSPDYYRWKLHENPTARGHLAVAIANGQIVGSATITPKPLRLLGETIVGAEIGDTFTAAEFQRQGIFSALVRLVLAAAQEDGISFVYGTPNASSLPGYEAKLGFPAHPSAGVALKVRPVRPTKVLRAHWSGGSAFHRTASVPIGLLAEVAYWARGSFRRATGVTIQSLAADAPFEEMAEVAATTAGRSAWSVHRTPEYLRWRFHSNPDEYALHLCRVSGTLRGYLVSKRGGWHGLRCSYIADHAAVDGSSMSALLSSTLTRDVDLVASWSSASDAGSAALRRAGFVRRSDVPIIVHQGATSPRETASWDWRFVMSDSDNI